MLVLQRHKGESLCINDNITITVLKSNADGVKLAIDAPKDVKILRTELKEAMAENQKASATIPMNVIEQIMNNKE